MPARAYVIQEAPPWPDGTVTFDLQLGAPAGPLLDGATSWDAVAQSALEIWNRQIARVRLVGVAGSTASTGQGNGRNNVFFADRAYEHEFGDRTLAITVTSWSRGRRLESDVVFNRGESWNSYRGSIRRGSNDLRRVAIHEFGHALGLDHPNDAGQTVTAVMNATTSSLDTLAADDIAGVQAIYGAGVGQPPVGGRLINLAVRSPAGSGDRTLIVGFVTAGSNKTVLVRGVGPTLAEYGVTTPAPDPRLTVFRTDPGNVSTQVAANDTWGGGAALSAAFTTTGAFALPTTSADAALQTVLPADEYSAHVTEAGGRTGVALLEVYAAGPANESGRFINFSARTQVGTGSDLLIAGFVVGGDANVRLLIRGVGPTLAAFGVNDRLADPRVQVFRNGAVVAENDDWGANATAVLAAREAAGAFNLASGSADAALVVDLPPAAYTAHVSGVGGTTGVGLVEVYLLP